jgi:CspA family cold shock protein
MREIGVVKFWKETKGWGYIIRDGKPDIFVHYREICGEGRKDLSSSSKVSFEERVTPYGVQACEVKPEKS